MCMLDGECISCFAIALPCSMSTTMTFRTIERLDSFFLAIYC